MRRQPTIPQFGEWQALRARLQETSLSIGIPSFNEGSGIVHTLRSVLEAIRSLGLSGVTFVLSDSSETTATVDAARSWAQEKDVRLVVDRSERQRSQKEARNVIMARASSDLLVNFDADVIVPPMSLFHLLRCLSEPPLPAVAVGVAGADPRYRALRFRASAWQLNASRRLASWLPNDAIRAQGACWGAWRSFYRDYRFPIGASSLHDDVTLARHLLERGLPARNCWRAVVYKVPAGTLGDFMVQTHRSYAADGDSQPRFRRLAAGAVEGAKDPLGAGLYLHARMWSAREQRRSPKTWGEAWEVTTSTKR